MCGIVGVLAKGEAAPLLMDGLKALEYRGYDSAGVATLDGDGAICRRRAPGKLSALRAMLESDPIAGRAGLGHTRWATHGAPVQANAHPQVSGRVALVHNGIIENHAALRAELERQGRVFLSDTDTEAVSQLCDRYLAQGHSPFEAVRRTLARLEGTWALAFLFGGEADLMIAARRGSPLLLGLGEGEVYVASSVLALQSRTQRICMLEEGDCALLSRRGATVFDGEGRRVNRPLRTVAAIEVPEKGAYRHFMEKEIFEQPELLAYATSRYLGEGRQSVAPVAGLDFARLPRLRIIGCGTAYHAGMIGKYWFEHLARLPVEVDIASEFRYRAPVFTAGEAALFISQSGETADTLAAMRHAKDEGVLSAALLNSMESAMRWEADIALPVHARPEIGVASTKAFTCQLAALACLALLAARQRGHMTAAAQSRRIAELTRLSRLFGRALSLAEECRALAQRLAGSRSVLYVARGALFPLALEGALKMKELSYIHAEGCAAGELKHGPLALVDGETPVVALAPSDDLFPKAASNIAEIAARGGRVCLISDEQGVRAINGAADMAIALPDCPAFLAPVLYAAPMQLLACFTALAMGRDVDRPRNLAKSVTVE